MFHLLLLNYLCVVFLEINGSEHILNNSVGQQAASLDFLITNYNFF